MASQSAVCGREMNDSALREPTGHRRLGFRVQYKDLARAGFARVTAARTTMELATSGGRHHH